MSKKTQKPDIPNDMWLHVATDALARWAAGGGEMQALDTIGGQRQALMIVLDGISVDDPRLASAFLSHVMITEAPPLSDGSQS